MNEYVKIVNVLVVVTEKLQTSDDKLSQAYKDIEDLTVQVRKVSRELSEKTDELSQMNLKLENEKVILLRPIKFKADCRLLDFDLAIRLQFIRKCVKDTQYLFTQQPRC